MKYTGNQSTMGSIIYYDTIKVVIERRLACWVVFIFDKEADYFLGNHLNEQDAVQAAAVFAADLLRKQKKAAAYKTATSRNVFGKLAAILAA